MGKRSPTTKDISLLRQLYDAGQLRLAPEFQRNNVWPRPAKAYLIDTILNDRPMPLFFFQRGRSAQSGMPIYSVVDGQQRLRAIFEFLDDRIKLTESTDPQLKDRRYSELQKKFKDKVFDYDLSVEELSGHTDDEIRDIFIRMNKYVVKLSLQELRHAKEAGVFYDFVEELGRWDFWAEYRVFTPTQLRRMRQVELSAELTILLIEGAQDKKNTIDLYYGMYKDEFPAGSAISDLLDVYLNWIAHSIQDFTNTRFRKPVDLYSLIGALDIVTDQGSGIDAIDTHAVSEALHVFDAATKRQNPRDTAAAYVVAASRQTDNIGPRNTRIRILTEIIREA